MSTSCLIGVKIEQHIEAIYCHWDGYPEGKYSVGQLLKDHYLDMEKILKLIKLGDLSRLGERPIIHTEACTPYSPTYRMDRIDYTRCVTLDLGDDNSMDNHSYDSEEDYIQYFNKADVDFAYIFKNGHWEVLGRRGKKFKKF